MSNLSSPLMTAFSVDLEKIAQHIYRVAYEKYRQASNWVEFYREIFGVRGLLRQMLPIPALYHQFQKTQEYVEIQRMLAHLRERSQPIRDEQTTVITVRIPKSLHDALVKEAHDHNTSLNQYCISKLVQLLDSRVFPPEELPPEEKPPQV